MAFPVYWMVASRPSSRVRTSSSRDPKFFPIPATMDNFTRVIQDKGDFFHHFSEELHHRDPVRGDPVDARGLPGCHGGRALQLQGAQGPHLIMLLAVQMVPFEALLISMYVMLDSMGQVNKLTGVMIAYMAFVLPFTIWTLRGFIANIPKDLEQAAMIDGCSQGQAFRKILFPLIAPGLVATAVFSFILVWNDYLIAYVLLRSPEKQTLGIWLASFTTNHGTEWGAVMAGSTLFAIPAVVFFLLVQRRVVSGLTAGAVKG